MPLFRKKPVVVEAIRWDGANGSEIAEWAGDAISFPGPSGRMPVHTIHGTVHAEVGAWIVKTPAGDFYPCSNDVFVSLHEPVTN